MENGNSEQQEFAFERLLDEIRSLGDRIAQNRNDWPRITSFARSLLRQLNLDVVMQSQRRIPDQALAIATLQRIAYHDADAGGVQDIAEWCLSQWLRILQHDSQNVDALRGSICTSYHSVQANYEQDSDKLGFQERSALWREFIEKKVVLQVAHPVDPAQPAARTTLQAMKPETQQEQWQRPMRV